MLKNVWKKLLWKERKITITNAYMKKAQKVDRKELQIARARRAAHLTQAVLAKRIHTTKSVISRYESADYNKYSVSLLNRIAHACSADLKVVFTSSK